MNNEQAQTEGVEHVCMEEQHAAFLQSAQEYISIKEAARIMGVSSRSVYDSIQRGKLLTARVGSSLSVSLTSARTYRRTCVGRPRSRVPIWRVPVTRNLQYLWIITARLRQGQQEQLAQRLEEIRLDREHQLPGTVARYIVQDKVHPEQIQFVLIWRQLAMPPDEERAAAIAAFQANLADIIEWETSSTTEGCVVLNA